MQYRLQQLVDKHSTEISALLKDLCSEGYLVPENKGRWTIYRLNITQGKAGIQGDLFERKDDTSEEKMTPLERKDDTSEEKMTPLERKDDTSEEKMTPDRKKWMRVTELMSLVIEVCSDDFKGVEEIAISVHRTSTYLKNKILPVLLKEGELERLYPTIPNHPNQAYKKRKP